VIARHHRHAGLLHQRLGAVLQAHGADRGGRRADEDDARGGAGLGELRVLGEEAVARMDRLGAAFARLRRSDALDDEVALARRRRADAVRLVGHAHMRASASASE
jgi:hypothetical protein